MKNPFKKIDETLQDLEQATAHAATIQNAALDFVNSIENKGKNPGAGTHAILDAVTISEQGKLAYSNLKTILGK